MTQSLSAKYLTLLIAIQQHPTDKIEKIADRVGLSRTTVSKDLKWLQGVTPKSEKRYFRVVPDFDEAALGLETLDVFIEVKRFESIKALEKLCDDHPYTKYRARCYGAYRGLFVQFRIPIGSTPMISELLRLAEEKGILLDFTILSTSSEDPVFSVSQLKHWNRESFTWDFDWGKWAAKEIKVKPKKATTSVPNLDILTKRDVGILTQLSFGARRKQKDIIEALKRENFPFTSQDFSRRLQILSKNFIRGWNVFYDYGTFDLYSNVILTARCKTKFAKDLEARMSSKPIPFRSTLKIKGGFLLWFLRLPPTHLSSVLTYLQENVDELNVSIVDYMHSQVYALWAEAFNEETRSWRTDSAFMVDSLL